MDEGHGGNNDNDNDNNINDDDANAYDYANEEFVSGEDVERLLARDDELEREAEALAALARGASTPPKRKVVVVAVADADEDGRQTLTSPSDYFARGSAPLSEVKKLLPNAPAQTPKQPQSLVRAARSRFAYDAPSSLGLAGQQPRTRSLPFSSSSASPSLPPSSRPAPIPLHLERSDP